MYTVGFGNTLEWVASNGEIEKYINVTKLNGREIQLEF